MTTKENINNDIEKSLAHLLKQLKKAKIKEANRGIFSRQSEFEMLNEGIKALENIQFASFDDFQSIKELVEIEQFFSRSLTLSAFVFPDYRSLVEPALIAYIELEVQLDTLELKAHDLICRDYKLAASEAQNVVVALRDLNLSFFVKRQLDYEAYKDSALQIINKSRPELEHHRGYKKILGNLVLLILTVGTAFLIHKACKGDFFFFKQTKTSQAANALNQIITTVPLLPPLGKISHC